MDKDKLKTIDIYNEKSLNLLNIKDLRDMGRKFGVPSPTTRSKQDLISYILKIVYGEVMVTERNVYGRPNVREFDMDRYLKKIEKNSIVSPESAVYMQALESANLDKVSAPGVVYDDGNIIEQRVYVEEDSRCYLRKKAFVKSDDDIEIEKVFAIKYSLENLDVLEVVVSNDDFKILTINGIKPNDKFKELELAGTIVRGGTKQDFRFSTKEEIDLSILNLQKKTEEIGAKMFIFSSEKYAFENTCSVVYGEAEKASDTYKKFMCFLGECEKAIFDLEDIVVVIDQPDRLEDVVSSFDEDVQSRVKKHLQSEMSKILSLGNVLIVYHLDAVVTY